MLIIFLQRTPKDAKKFNTDSSTYSGFIEVLFKGSSWIIYWGAVKDKGLHLYQSQQSDLPLRSIPLSKYIVQTNSSKTDKPHCLVLTHQSSFPIYISFSDSLEKQRWLQVLLKGTQDPVLQSEKDSISSFEVLSYDACVYVWYSISLMQSGSVKLTDSRGSALDQLTDSRGSALDQLGGTPEDTLEKKKQRILKQYDRNMKKTHKVSR